MSPVQAYISFVYAPALASASAATPTASPAVFSTAAYDLLLCVRQARVGTEIFAEVIFVCAEESIVMDFECYQ